MEAQVFERMAEHAQSITDEVRSQLPTSSQRIGAGGELIPAADIGADSGALALKNTVDNPDYVSADASRARLATGLTPLGRGRPTANVRSCVGV